MPNLPMNERMMRALMVEHGISLVYIPEWGQWYAGDSRPGTVGEILTNVRSPAPTGEHNEMHFSDNPEEALEDYCNARGIDWESERYAGPEYDD